MKSGGGGVRAPLTVSYSDLGRLDDSSGRKSTGLMGESTGADSDRARVSFISGNLVLIGVPRELGASAKPSWLRLNSPAPRVCTADRLWWLVSSIGVCICVCDLLGGVGS